MRYTVESLEPRYLLSAVALTDHTQSADTHGTSGTGQLTANQYDANQVAISLSSLIGQLSYLGQQIDKTSITNPLNQSVIPLLNETVSQLTKAGTVTTATPNGITLGELLFSDSSTVTAIANVFTSDFSSSNPTLGTVDVTSGKLASDLQTALQGIFGSSFTVTDNSALDPSGTGGQLDLAFAYTESSNAITTPIVLGNAAPAVRPRHQPDGGGRSAGQCHTLYGDDGELRREGRFQQGDNRPQQRRLRARPVSSRKHKRHDPHE